MILTDCPAGVHASAEACDTDPWCAVDDPACFGNRCSDHDACEPPGPGVLGQVVTAATGYGHVARCGCGWKSVCETSIAALVSGRRHVRTAHPPEQDSDRKGDVA